MGGDNHALALESDSIRTRRDDNHGDIMTRAHFKAHTAICAPIFRDCQTRRDDNRHVERRRRSVRSECGVLRSASRRIRVGAVCRESGMQEEHGAYLQHGVLQWYSLASFPSCYWAVEWAFLLPDSGEL